MDDSNNLDLHQVVDNYIHNLEALHEVLPIQLALASVAAQKADKKHKLFLDNNAEKLEEDDDSTKYKLNYKDVRNSYRLGRKSDRAKTVVGILPKNFHVSYVSEFDSYLGNLLTKILIFKPEIIDSKDKNISLSDLVELGSIEAAREQIISKEVESFLRSSHMEQFAWMERNFSITLTKGLDSWPNFVELTERRNLFVHCDGVVSEQYLKVCNRYDAPIDKEIVLGRKLEADIRYLRQSYEVLYEIGLKLSQVLWRKLSPNEIKRAESSLSHFIYELLIEENYSLAIRLLDFACCTLKKWYSEGTRLMYVINRAIAYKFSGNNDKCQSILSSQDWSACGDNYNICVSVLQDDFKDAKEVMLRIGNSGLVGEVDYIEWPCFKDFRDTSEFTTGFTEVFGYQPTTIEQIEKNEANEKYFTESEDTDSEDITQDRDECSEE
jgi:hypothetical protein